MTANFNSYIASMVNVVSDRGWFIAFTALTQVPLRKTR